MDEIQINRIDTITGQIIACKQSMGRSILEIGKLLIEAKDALPHGDWGNWLRERVEFSERTAQNFMRVAREYASNPQLVADLGSVRKAIALLDVPEEEREVFVEETDAAQLTARQLEAAIRERNVAIEERETAEASRYEMERSLQTANGTIARLNEHLAQQRKELEDLRSKPTEVAVETVVDEAAVKKAAKEAAKEAKEKAEKKAAAALESEQAKVKALEEELEKARASSDTQRAEDAEAQVEKLRRELAIAQNPDVLACQICFDQIKSLANQMQGYILRLKAKEQAEEYGKCKTALAALAQALGKAAEGV